MMVNAHTKAGAELKTFANKKSIPLPTFLQETKIQLIKNIDKFKNDERNEFYAHLMVEDHRKITDIFNKAAASGDMVISDFAKPTQPTLEHHYKMAKELEVKVAWHKKNQGDDPLKLNE